MPLPVLRLSSVAWRSGRHRSAGIRVALAISCVVLAACEDPNQLSPIAPSESGEVPDHVAQAVRREWSPYLGIHLDGRARDAYRDAVTTLQAVGRLRGARIEITRRLPPNDPIFDSLAGVELLGLISNEYLFSSNIEREIDQIFRSFPQIQYFQIGNEVTTILPAGGPQMDVETYMRVFRRVYDHVQARYSGRATLLTQAPIGSGPGGSVELEAMARLGLTELDPGRVIVGVNAYDIDTANQFLSVLGNELRRYRVWVTESGIRGQDLHLPWVSDVYPRLRNLLRAERLYWYILWGEGPDVDFSLIQHPGRFPRYEKRPLFQVLAER